MVSRQASGRTSNGGVAAPPRRMEYRPGSFTSVKSSVANVPRREVIDCTGFVRTTLPVEASTTLNSLPAESGAIAVFAAPVG